MPFSTKLLRILLTKLLYIIGLAVGAKKSIIFLCYMDILYIHTLFVLNYRLENSGCKVFLQLLLLVLVIKKFFETIDLTTNTPKRIKKANKKVFWEGAKTMGLTKKVFWRANKAIKGKFWGVTRKLTGLAK